jgi:hypothetical protein
MAGTGFDTAQTALGFRKLHQFLIFLISGSSFSDIEASRGDDIALKRFPKWLVRITGEIGFDPRPMAQSRIARPLQAFVQAGFLASLYLSASQFQGLNANRSSTQARLRDARRHGWPVARTDDRR